MLFPAHAGVIRTKKRSWGSHLTFPRLRGGDPNSKKSVSLGKNMGSTSYLVMTELVKSDGPVGDIEVSEKLVNGFKLAYNGSAKSATIKYIAIGGTLK